MSFRFHRGIRVPYDQQGYIYFAARNVKKLPIRQQEKLRSCCENAAGEYADALWELLTVGTGYVAVCQKHHLSQATLFRCVKRFYESFPL